MKCFSQWGIESFIFAFMANKMKFQVSRIVKVCKQRETLLNYTMHATKESPINQAATRKGIEKNLLLTLVRQPHKKGR